MGSMSSPVVTSYRRLIVTAYLSPFSQCSDWSRTNACTEGQTIKGGNFIGRQTLELCNEIDHWFVQQSIATVHRSKQRNDRTLLVRIFFCIFLSMQCKHKQSLLQLALAILTTLTLSLVTPHTFHARRCSSYCYCCLQLGTMPLCEHP